MKRILILIIPLFIGINCYAIKYAIRGMVCFTRATEANAVNNYINGKSSLTWSVEGSYSYVKGVSYATSTINNVLVFDWKINRKEDSEEIENKIYNLLTNYSGRIERYNIEIIYNGHDTYPPIDSMIIRRYIK